MNIDKTYDIEQRFSIEPHGDGYTLYHGRDNQHHGMNLAQIFNTDQKTIRLIETALNFYNENFVIDTKK